MTGERTHAHAALLVTPEALESVTPSLPNLAVASHTDGVVLVTQSHQTRTEALRHAAHAIHQGGIRLLGVVVNRQKGQTGASYYGEYYGSIGALSEQPARPQWRPSPRARRRRPGTRGPPAMPA